MAKIKLPPALDKYGFWITIGVLGLLLIVFWWLGTGGVAESTKSNIGKIDSTQSTIAGIKPTANSNSLGEMVKENQVRKGVLGTKWKQVFEKQQRELIWPARKLEPGTGKVLEEGLSPEFIAAVTKLPPPERLNPEDPLAPNLKEQYRNFAQTQIQGVCNIVGSQYRLGNRRTGTARTNEKADDTVAPGEIVVWPASSQTAAQELLTFAEGGNPSTQDILYAQQNLWVYQTLFKIIRRTNESKKTEEKIEIAHYNAPVKRILDISVGKNYSPVSESDLLGLEKKGTRAVAEEPGEGEEGAAAAIPNIVKPAGLVYVDNMGERLKGAELAKLGGEALFKRMPISMDLEIDQRYLGELLVECANSPLTVEVKQVKFKTTGHIDRAAPTSGEETTPGNKGSSGSDEKSGKYFYDIPVKITGHIYIFYPPRAETPVEAAEGTEAVAAEATPVAAATPTPPVVAPAPAPMTNPPADTAVNPATPPAVPPTAPPADAPMDTPADTPAEPAPMTEGAVVPPASG